MVYRLMLTVRLKLSEYAKNRTDEHLNNLSQALKGNTNCLGNKHSKCEKTRRKRIRSLSAKNPDLTKRDGKNRKPKNVRKILCMGRWGLKILFMVSTHTSHSAT